MADGDSLDELAGYVSVERAAEMLDVNPSRIRQLIRDGDLHWRRWGRDNIMVVRSSVELLQALRPTNRARPGPKRKGSTIPSAQDQTEKQ